MSVNVSMDKVVIEFEAVPFSCYARRSIKLESMRLARRVVYNKLKLYCHQLNVRLGEEVYMHVFYKNFAETEGNRHTLRIETNPEYFTRLRGLLEPIVLD